MIDMYLREVRAACKGRAASQGDRQCNGTAHRLTPFAACRHRLVCAEPGHPVGQPPTVDIIGRLLPVAFAPGLLICILVHSDHIAFSALVSPVQLRSLLAGVFFSSHSEIFPRLFQFPKQ